MSTVEYLWDVVNNCDSILDVCEAERLITSSDVCDDDYDELMDALAYISRECYRRKGGRA